MRYALFLLLLALVFCCSRVFAADTLVHEYQYTSTYDGPNRNVPNWYLLDDNEYSASKNYKFVCSYSYSSEWKSADISSSQSLSDIWDGLDAYYKPGCVYTVDDYLNTSIIYTPNFGGDSSVSYTFSVAGSLLESAYQVRFSYFRGCSFTVKVYETSDDPENPDDPDNPTDPEDPEDPEEENKGPYDVNVINTPNVNVINNPTVHISNTPDVVVTNPVKINDETPIKVDVTNKPLDVRVIEGDLIDYEKMPGSDNKPAVIKPWIEVPAAPKDDVDPEFQNPVKSATDKLHPDVLVPEPTVFIFPRWTIPLVRGRSVVISLDSGLTSYPEIREAYEFIRTLVYGIAHVLITIVTLKFILKLFRKNS